MPMYSQECSEIDSQSNWRESGVDEYIEMENININTFTLLRLDIMPLDNERGVSETGDIVTKSFRFFRYLSDVSEIVIIIYRTIINLLQGLERLLKSVAQQEK